jgi:hypothetical protein
MTNKDQEDMAEYIDKLMELAQWACSESWEEIGKTTNHLIRLINKEQNK